MGPDRLPCPPTKFNRKTLEDYIKNHYKASAFNLCKRQLWPITAGEPMRMHTNENAVPMYCRKRTKIPLHFREEIKKGLESDVMKGILEKVLPGEVDRWCSRMVIQPKKNGTARRTIDLVGGQGRRSGGSVNCLLG